MLTELPADPIPRPADTDPVGCSSTLIFTVAVSFELFSIEVLTELKIPEDFKLSIDFFNL